MTTLKNWATQATTKLTAEMKSVSGQKERAMMGAVCDALKDFCLQDEEFAQAIVQGGTFAECMKKVAAGVGNHISDLEAYKKAVQFYFPGAEIQMQMTIDLIGEAAGKTQTEPAAPTPVAAPPKVISLDLADFFM